MLTSKIQKNIIFLIITFLFFAITPNIHAANNWYYATMSGSANVSPAYGGFSETQCNTLRQTRITTGLASGQNWDVTPCVLVTKTPPVMGSDLNATFTYIQDLVTSGEIKQYWLEYQNNTSNIYTIMGPFESIQSCNGWWSTGGNNGNTLTKPCFESKTTPIATTTPENPTGGNTIHPAFFITPDKLTAGVGQTIKITANKKVTAAGDKAIFSSPNGGTFSSPGRQCAVLMFRDNDTNNERICTVNFSSQKAGTFVITAVTVDMINGQPVSNNSNTISVTFTESTAPPSSTDTNYTLLAPLPGLESFESNPAKNPCAFGKYMNAMIKIFIGISAVLAMLMIIWGGIEYMKSSLPSGKEAGRGTITHAILGLLIALSAYVILYTINPNLLNLCLDQQLPTVDVTIDTDTEETPWTESAQITGTTNLCTEGYVNVPTQGQPTTITVCRSISNKLTLMLAAAKRDNIILSGYGSRTFDQQSRLRRLHGCPNPSTPSSSCNPPTARPGHSKHESGKAIDFNCNGASLSSTSGNRCLVWLRQHAKDYGFFNLRSEPWHWSDTGN